LFADDLGWVDVSTGNSNGGRGSEIYETPNIDHIAAEGMSFTHAYTQQNCSPTRASLISGQYAPGPDNGVYNVVSLARQDKKTEGFPNLPIDPPEQNKYIADHGVSIFNMARNAGFHTCFIGKSHGTPHPLGKGYGLDIPGDVHHMLKGTVKGEKIRDQYYLALKDDKKGWTFNSKFVDRYAAPYDSAYIDSVLAPLKNGNDPTLLARTPKHLTDAIGDFCVDYIKDRAEERAPFFLYVPFHAVHYKVVGRKDLVEKYKARGLDAKMAEYAGMVELLDQNVGKVLRAIKDPNGDGKFDDDLSADTLVVLFSDNGGCRGNGPLTGGKGVFQEGGLRVPLMCKWPGVIAPNTVTDQAVHCVDLYPTFAEILGADVRDRRLDGTSFAKILNGEKKRLDRKNLFWHFPGYMGSRLRPSSMIQTRVGDQYYKLFYSYETETWGLFHVNEDLGEQNDLLQQPLPEQLTGLVKTMKHDLRAWLVESDAPTGTWAKDGSAVPYPSGF
jgi:arylsulfatase A-like enzyme